MDLTFVRLGRFLAQIHACIEQEGVVLEDISSSDWTPPRGAQTYISNVHLARELMKVLGRSHTDVFNIAFQICLAFMSAEKPKGIGAKSNNPDYKDKMVKLAEQLETVATEMNNLMSSDKRYGWYPFELSSEIGDVYNKSINIKWLVTDAITGDAYARGYKDALDAVVEWLGRDQAKELFFAIQDDLKDAGVPDLADAGQLWTRYLTAVRKEKLSPAVSTVSAISET